MDSVVQYFAMLSEEEQIACMKELGSFKNLKKKGRTTKGVRTVNTSKSMMCNRVNYNMCDILDTLDTAFGEPAY